MKPDVRNQLERLLDYARAVSRLAKESPERSDTVAGGRGYLGGAVETLHYLSLLTDDEQHEWFERLMSELPPDRQGRRGIAGIALGTRLSLLPQAEAGAMPEDYFEKVTKSATTMLSRWDGSSALVRELTLSLRSLSIVLFADRATMQRRNLVIHADPLWMSGPFAWDRSELRVEVIAGSSTVLQAKDRLFRVHDPVGFELLTGSLQVKENVTLK